MSVYTESYDDVYANLDTAPLGITVLATPGRKFINVNSSLLNPTGKTCFEASSQWILCFPSSSITTLSTFDIELQLDEILPQNLTRLPDGLEELDVLSPILSIQDVLGNINDGTVTLVDIGISAWLSLAEGTVETMTSPPYHILHALETNSAEWGTINDIQFEISSGGLFAVGAKVEELGAFVFAEAQPSIIPSLRTLAYSDRNASASQDLATNDIFYSGQRSLQRIFPDLTIYRVQDIMANGKLDENAMNTTWKRSVHSFKHDTSIIVNPTSTKHQFKELV